MRTTVRELLVVRRGVVFVSSLSSLSSLSSHADPGPGDAVAESHLRAFELEVADLGYVTSSRLRSRLAVASLDELTGLHTWLLRVLARHAGADQKHEPLFRRFPEGVPDDTVDLWWKKVLVHFLQVDDQPCLFCRREGTTHVLDPCGHIVCDHCFDGSNYSACPSCECHVDRSSPFFLASPDRHLPDEKVVFKLLDLGESVVDDAKALFVSLCERKQVLSPTDLAALVTLVEEYRAEVLRWLPEAIPVRENVATIFGSLFKACDPADVLPDARRFMTTATDVLRFIKVLSGDEASLLPATILVPAGTIAHHRASPKRVPRSGAVPLAVRRFKVAKISRPLRRALLGVLEGIDRDRLLEDMLRHRSYWVWVGEFLHPHEYASRFPNVAAAFAVVRKKAPDGTPATPFRGWSTELEDARRRKDDVAMLALLRERPGELARRVDLVLRTASDDHARERALSAIAEKVPAFSTPVLLTLRGHLPTRLAKAPTRVYWPPGRHGTGVIEPDERPLLPRSAVDPLVQFIDGELLRRFARKASFADGFLDEGLKTIIVPFNERTASPSALSLPRGSRISIPEKKLVRLFLHWCEPSEGGHRTDLDLSIGLYRESWQFFGLCSYRQLKLTGHAHGRTIAQSSGDLRSGPWPDGASEFVDLHREQALAAGVRYAVMVVENFAGMAFSELARGFAGVMLRDDDTGTHFDPRTVELKFALGGENGSFFPLVFDLRENVVHWLDIYAKNKLGMVGMNSAVCTICPSLMSYFASGARTSMFDLGLLHAAARCKRVFVRGEDPSGAQRVSEFVRRDGEDAAAFHSRLVRGEADEPRSRGPRTDGPPLLALLQRGDVDLPNGSLVYALFRERLTPSLAASDLLS